MPKLARFSFAWRLTLCWLPIAIAACSESLENAIAPDPALRERSGLNSPGEMLREIPEIVPRYPNARLQTTEVEGDRGTLVLLSSDSVASVIDYYRAEWQAGDWEIVESFTQTKTGTETIVARWENWRIRATISPLEGSSNAEQSRIDLSYERREADTPERSQPDANPRERSQPEETEFQPSSVTFTDLDRAPEPLRPYVRDVATLGVISPISTENPQEFAPNRPIARREFARWLFETNNRIYRDRPGYQIRPVEETPQPAFEDISPSDRDFAIVQGLAEAGLVPSRLTGKTTEVLFRPEAPLTREALLTWKVPLDTRTRFPEASLATIQETWGFQDATKIDPKGLQALLADYSLGERSNLRRVFGYTQLFQPDKPVTRAEAAASLWYFGTPGDGRSAREIFEVAGNDEDRSQSDRP